jgi:hypothetical protein
MMPEGSLVHVALDYDRGASLRVSLNQAPPEWKPQWEEVLVVKTVDEFESATIYVRCLEESLPDLLQRELPPEQYVEVVDFFLAIAGRPLC